MKERRDIELLLEFGNRRDEAAFRELVTRHFDLVYSVALRQLNGDVHHAEDVAQIVFTDLARKAKSFGRRTVLSGWLYKATRFAAAKVVRREQRRRSREEVLTMNAFTSAASPDWEKLSPILDIALSELNTVDRDALLLRFYERYDLRAVGDALGLSEDAAQKRVSRALDKLRGRLTRRGVALPACALATSIATSAVQSAPAGMAAAVAAGSLGAETAILGLSGLLQLAGAAKLKMAGVVLIATSIAAPWLLQHRAVQSLRVENASLREQMNKTLARGTRSEILAAENADSSGHLEEEAHRAEKDRVELMRLRGQVTALRQAEKEVAVLKLERDNLLKRVEERTNAPGTAKPDPRVSSITFTGNTFFTDAQLLNALSSKVGEPLDRRNIDRDVREIYKMYKEAGFRFSNVRCAEEGDLTLRERALTFVVSESPPAE
jgi:RNA polymerase sigma factor (sigma-70 family)